MSERLQKFLAKAGVGSRRFCEELIKSKKIKINGKVAEIGVSVDITDVIEYEGNEISYVKSDLKLLMLNKPEGVVSSNKKEKNLPIVFDYLPKSNLNTRWISIGRLDINSSGLMLFTNDGTFANFCMHPSSMIDREYLVRARGEFTQEKKQKMLSGINIEGLNELTRWMKQMEERPACKKGVTIPKRESSKKVINNAKNILQT